MKPGDCAAGDSDAYKRKHRTRKDKAAAIDEFGNRRHLQCRIDQHDSSRKHGYGTEFQKCAEVIAGRQQHPHGQNRRRQSINHDGPRQPLLVVTEPAFNRGKVREKLAAPHAKRETKQAKDRDRHHAHFAGAQSNAHDQCDRNRHRDGENAPGTFCESLHYD